MLDIFRFSRMALNHVLTVPQYSRRRELSESCLNIFYLPIFDRFMALKLLQSNFGPNVRYCFLGHNENELKHKFHGLVGPPAAIFQKNCNLQNQEESFCFSKLKMAWKLVLTVRRHSRRRELSESYLNIFYLPNFDRFTAYRSSKNNFGPNVIYCFLDSMIFWKI